MSAYIVWSYKKFKAIICTWYQWNRNANKRCIFLKLCIVFPYVWLDISDSLLDFTSLYCVDGRQHMQGEEYLNIDGAQPG